MHTSKAVSKLPAYDIQPLTYTEMVLQVISCPMTRYMRLMSWAVILIPLTEALARIRSP